MPEMNWGLRICEFTFRCYPSRMMDVFHLILRAGLVENGYSNAFALLQHLAEPNAEPIESMKQGILYYMYTKEKLNHFLYIVYCTC